MMLAAKVHSKLLLLVNGSDLQTGKTWIFPRLLKLQVFHHPMASWLVWARAEWLQLVVTWLQLWKTCQNTCQKHPETDFFRPFPFPTMYSYRLSPTLVLGSLKAVSRENSWNMWPFWTRQLVWEESDWRIISWLFLAKEVGFLSNHKMSWISKNKHGPHEKKMAEWCTYIDLNGSVL